MLISLFFVMLEGQMSKLANAFPQCLEGLPRKQHRAQPVHIVLDVGPADDGHVGDVAPSVDSLQPEPGTVNTY